MNIDIDKKHGWDVFYTIAKVIFLARNAGLDVHCYETYKGYHIRIQDSLTVTQNMDVRRYIGDDEYRLLYDELRVTNHVFDLVDTLYKTKYVKGKEYYAEREIECERLLEVI